ncbi:hypothetical protein CDAR_551691 [Caerostris darwini]|uniref:Uncharacterized protein n=1 Tax=Caerostris darwini TaxID=1538125 RepID=A0AAV4V7Z1_9ARAC|nr:hypothetical protein CDAR_551691 [Caerostris darwini]
MTAWLVIRFLEVIFLLLLVRKQHKSLEKTTTDFLPKVHLGHEIHRKKRNAVASRATKMSLQLDGRKQDSSLENKKIKTSAETTIDFLPKVHPGHEIHRKKRNIVASGATKISLQLDGIMNKDIHCPVLHKQLVDYMFIQCFAQTKVNMVKNSSSKDED